MIKKVINENDFDAGGLESDQGVRGGRRACSNLTNCKPPSESIPRAQAAPQGKATVNLPNPFCIQMSARQEEWRPDAAAQSLLLLPGLAVFLEQTIGGQWRELQAGWQPGAEAGGARAGL